MCKYSDDWSMIGWLQTESWYTGLDSHEGVYRVTSIYDVYCNKCKKFVNLLDGKEIDPDGRVVMNRRN